MIWIVYLFNIVNAALIDRVDVTSVHLMPLSMCNMPSTWSSWNVTDATAWLQLGSDFDLSELSSLVVKTKVGYSDFQISKIIYSADKYNLVGITLPSDIQRNLILGSYFELSIQLSTATKVIRPDSFTVTPNPIYKVRALEECAGGAVYNVASSTCSTSSSSTTSSTSSVCSSTTSSIQYPITSTTTASVKTSAPVYGNPVVYTTTTSSTRAVAVYDSSASNPKAIVFYPQSIQTPGQNYKTTPALVAASSRITNVASVITSKASAVPSSLVTAPPQANPGLKANDAFKNSYCWMPFILLLGLF